MSISGTVTIQIMMRGTCRCCVRACDRDEGPGPRVPCPGVGAKGSGLSLASPSHEYGDSNAVSVYWLIHTISLCKEGIPCVSETGLALAQVASVVTTNQRHSGFLCSCFGQCAHPHLTRFPLLLFTLTSLPLINCVPTEGSKRGRPNECHHCNLLAPPPSGKPRRADHPFL